VEAVKTIFIAFLILISSSCLAREVPFDDVIRHPERFDRQRVTVRGLLETGGDDHELWRDVSALKHQDLDRSIHVWPDLSRPTYPGTNMSPDSPANLHWVKLTGIIDMSIHGRFGTERFGMTLEKIEILPGRRLKEFLPVLSWFKNESGVPVEVYVQSRDQATQFTLGPKGLSLALTEGSKCTAKITQMNKRAYAKAALTGPRTKNYYDAEKKYYYFRIAENRVEPVLPAVGRRWDTKMPDRD
jgi:hypothetical protein